MKLCCPKKNQLHGLNPMAAQVRVLKLDSECFLGNGTDGSLKLCHVCQASKMRR